MLVKINTESADLGDAVLIKVGDRTAIIDKEDAHRITPYKWHLKKGYYNFYAYRNKTTNGVTFRVYMHRQIMRCPTRLIVHHKNHNGLDNRKVNLGNMTKEEHNILHRFQ